MVEYFTPGRGFKPAKKRKWRENVDYETTKVILKLKFQIFETFSSCWIAGRPDWAILTNWEFSPFLA
jgi:hypothetical protein